MNTSQPSSAEDRRARGFGRAAIVLLQILFGWNVFRATMQSITTDEAFSYLHYIGTDRFSLLREYTANVHFLHTLLVWCSVHLFGLSELTMRIPSLLGCALYFAAIWKICHLQFGNRFACLAGVAVLAANPLIEDHLSASRGYGLGLALFAWALYEGLLAVRDPENSTASADNQHKHLLRIAIFSALSAASNLTFLPPSGALIGIVAWMLWQKSSGVGLAAFVSDLWKHMAGPWILLLFVTLVIPLSRVGPGTFYFGADSIHDSVHSLLEMSGGGARATATATDWVGSAIFLGFAALFVLLLLRWKKGRVDSFGLLTTGTFLVTAIGLALGHAAVGLAYPLSRTGLYLIFLALLSLVWIGRWLLGSVVLLLLAGAMLYQIQPDRYQEWPWDKDNRQIAQTIMALNEDGRPTRVLTSQFLDLSLKFYARMYRLDWMTSTDIPGGPYDYQVKWAWDRKEVDQLGLRFVSMGPTVGAVLAAKQ